MSSLASLLKGKYDQAFAAWQACATDFEAALPGSQQSALRQTLEETLSSALCALFLAKKAPGLRTAGILINNRDDLFQYLLIDNQASGQVTTTRIAAAISSVQCYIHRCLHGMEENINSTVLLDSFFGEWDQYNKSYSSWAGLSELAYYPENYVDPTLRYNQTPLQQALLTEISQSQLSKDSVENAYLNYLSGFEEVANLKVLCGYQHAATLDSGMSYFTGRSTSQPYSYYWRSLNNEAGDGMAGYVASAWHAWEEIQSPVNAINDEVRPVIFNNRLYIAWIEQQTESIPEGGKPPKLLEKYSLKLSYRKINGSWSPALSFPLTIPPELFDGKRPLFNLYLSYYALQDGILFMLYKPGEAGVGKVYGGLIDNGMQYQAITDEWNDVIKLFSNNLNGTDAANKLIREITALSYSSVVEEGSPRDSCPTEWLEVKAVGVKAEIDNLHIPPLLSCSASAHITTADLSKSPTKICEPGNPTDNSGDILTVGPCSVASVVSNSECTHTATFAITTKTTDYDASGTMSFQYITEESDDYDRSDLINVVKTGLSTADGKTYKFDFQLVMKPKYINRTIEVQTWNFTQSGDDKTHSVTLQKNQQGNATAAVSVTYRIPNSYDQLYYSWAVWVPVDETGSGQTTEIQSHLVLNDVKFTPMARALTVFFAGSQQPIARAQPGQHQVTLRYTQRLEKEKLLESIALKVIDTKAATCYWQRTDTLGYTGYTPGRAFDYRWDNNDFKDLPKNAATPAISNNISSLSGDGITTTHTLQVRQNKTEVFSQTFTIKVTKNEAGASNPKEYIAIFDEGAASYIEATDQVRRTRLNTLFARELINRAQSGLDRVLSWDTQQLQEPQLGEGRYFDITTEAYDSTTHGPSRNFAMAAGDLRDHDILYLGTLGDGEESHRFFIPGSLKTAEKFLHIFYSYGSDKPYDPSDSIPIKDIFADIGFSSHIPGMWLVAASVAKDVTSEPMDFSGANGLYFWELFYYTPMLVTEKLLQAQNFAEAERWLHYVFNPQGYVEGTVPNRHHVDRQWNTRPLAEDTAWDDTQTDSSDPDIVAQGDPMHYKIATWMKLLELIVARGDRAYRQLTPDSLNEARIWYVTALTLLGEEPASQLSSDWCDPPLSRAASDTLQNQQLEAMNQLLGGAPAVTAELRTANSLTALFLPAENGKLKGYWQTLRQRLYNLRHNLSLDGQPLILPLYASPADPKALQSAAAAASSGGAGALPNVGGLSIRRFPLMLDNARALVAQLMQYGSTLAAVIERRDSEALSALMQTQAVDLMLLSLQMQEKAIGQLKAEQKTLSLALEAATARHQNYQELLVDGGVSRTEQQAIDERLTAGRMTIAANSLRIAAASLNMAPNIFGLAAGGADWGGITHAIADGLDTGATARTISAEARATSEQYRRRAQEWEMQRAAAEHEIAQIKAQQAGLDIQLEATLLQKDYLQAQRQQMQAQLDFLKTKFSNEALYSWMQGRLSALFYQFYDLTIMRCLKAQLSYQWESGKTTTFIQPGAWDTNHAGLLCGEALMLSLAQLETAWQEWRQRTLEVMRTVSMAQAMQDVLDVSFNEAVNQVLDDQGSFGKTHKLELDNNQNLFSVTLDLAALDIEGDYPTALGELGDSRLIKQISVSLPALLGPYQDIQCVLSYSGSNSVINPSCCQVAISQGMNDSGLFQLDFNDHHYLPFEGLSISEGSLILRFPHATERQSEVLRSLNDIILHIRYTIRD